MIPTYKYQIKDSSVLTPYFYKYVVNPLFPVLVPWWIPANFITIIANLFIFGALYLSFQVPAGSSWAFLACAAGIFLYTLGDHFDGKQAKRTQTGSALGEFFDHFHDIFNNGIVLMLLFQRFGIENPYLVAFLLMISYWAHAALFYEQLKTKWLVFEKIGAVESVLFVILLFVVGSFDFGYSFLTMPVMGFKLIEIFLIASASGTLGTLLKCLKRGRITQIAFYQFLIASGITTWACSQLFEPAEIFSILILFNAVYIGNTQRAHLVDGIERQVNWLVPLLLLSCWVFTTVLPTVWGIDIRLVFSLLFAYLLLHTVWLMLVFILTLKSFWVWKNKPLANKA